MLNSWTVAVRSKMSLLRPYDWFYGSSFRMLCSDFLVRGNSLLTFGGQTVGGPRRSSLYLLYVCNRTREERTLPHTYTLINIGTRVPGTRYRFK